MQSLAQAEAIFGTKTETLLTNHLTKIFFDGTSDQTTLETAARLAGEFADFVHDEEQVGNGLAGAVHGGEHLIGKPAQESTGPFKCPTA